MSGGHFDYIGTDIMNHLQRIGSDTQVRERWPMTAVLLRRLGNIIYDIERAIDYDLCAAFDRDAIVRVVGAAIETIQTKEAQNEDRKRDKANHQTITDHELARPEAAPEAHPCS
ncbi:MAG: hypothetical protein ACTSP1_19890 [Candidatus Freyarchaeota archaeon]